MLQANQVCPMEMSAASASLALRDRGKSIHEHISSNFLHTSKNECAQHS